MNLDDRNFVTRNDSMDEADGRSRTRALDSDLLRDPRDRDQLDRLTLRDDDRGRDLFIGRRDEDDRPELDRRGGAGGRRMGDLLDFDRVDDERPKHRAARPSRDQTLVVLIRRLETEDRRVLSDRERAIERFVRLEESRSAPGSGLGLSLVAAVAEAHTGKLVLSDAGGPADRPGLVATLSLHAA